MAERKMVQSMKTFKHFFEEQESDLKASLINQISSLDETDPNTVKIIRSIEQFLSDQQVGGRLAAYNKRLGDIADDDLNKTVISLLAKKIASLDLQPDERTFLFDSWSNDTLLNVDKLNTPGLYTSGDLYNGYNEHEGIRELIDDLLVVDQYGQGKGEFALVVTSKQLSPASKGDVDYKGVGMLEVKTTHGGAPRFEDDDTQRALEQSGYNQIRDTFVKTYKNEIISLGLPVPPKTGYNLKQISDIYKAVQDKKTFVVELRKIGEALFPGKSKPIIDAIISGDLNSAKGHYANANVQHYLDLKRDLENLAAVVQIDLRRSPATFVVYKNVADLQKVGAYLHSGTAYMVGFVKRSYYPQIQVKVK
tara:strand:- start:189 stop:1280 length:1092 start_codon:yes stop_codon:yes gene_type:complete